MAKKHSGLFNSYSLDKAAMILKTGKKLLKVCNSPLRSPHRLPEYPVALAEVFPCSVSPSARETYPWSGTCSHVYVTAVALPQLRPSAVRCVGSTSLHIKAEPREPPPPHRVSGPSPFFLHQSSVALVFLLISTPPLPDAQQSPIP